MKTKQAQFHENTPSQIEIAFGFVTEYEWV